MSNSPIPSNSPIVSNSPIPSNSPTPSNAAASTGPVPFNTVIITNNYSESITVTVFYEEDGILNKSVPSGGTSTMSAPEGSSIDSVSIQSNKSGQTFNTSNFAKTSTLEFYVNENFQILIGLFNTVIITNHYSESINVAISYKNGNLNAAVPTGQTITLRSKPTGISIDSVTIQSNKGPNQGKQIFNTSAFAKTGTLVFDVNENFQISAGTGPFNTVIISNQYIKNIKVTIYYENSTDQATVSKGQLITLRSMPKGLGINKVLIESTKNDGQPLKKTFNTDNYDQLPFLYIEVDSKWKFSSQSGN